MEIAHNFNVLGVFTCRSCYNTLYCCSLCLRVCFVKSMYFVFVCTCVCACAVFDDGDERTLKRSSLCLKGGRHFDKSEVSPPPSFDHHQ